MAMRRGQHGQAMIEAVIACALVLVPIFLAIPVIAKYQDIRSHVVQGARYAAWERTVWFGGDAAEEMGIGKISSNKWDANEKGDDAIKNEIGARILAKNGAAFNSGNDMISSGTIDAHGMWRDRRGTALIGDYSGVGGGSDNNQSPGFVNDLLSPLLDVASIFSSFTLDSHAQYTSTLNLSVQEVAFNPDPLATGARAMKDQRYGNDFLVTGTTFTFSESNVIVANGWSANGPGSHAEFSSSDPAVKRRMSVYNQVRGLTPMSLMKPEEGSVFDMVLDVLNAISLVLFPELSTLDLGRIEVDRVPADRLQ